MKTILWTATATTPNRPTPLPRSLVPLLAALALLLLLTACGPV